MIPLIQKYPELESHREGFQYEDLINNVFIFERVKLETRPVDSIYHQAISADLEHNELIDFLIHQLLKSKLENRLTKGYDLGAGLDVNAKVCNKMNSFQSNHLKTSCWKAIHLKLGRQEFVKLLLYYNCFIRIEFEGIKNHIQLFGESQQSYSHDKLNGSNFLSKNKMLYKEEYQVRKLSPIPSTKLEALEQIFTSDFKDIPSRKVPKKLRKIHGILGKVITNNQACNYAYIVDGMCPVTPDYKEKDIRSVGTPSQDVIKLVLCIIDMLFPLECYGTKYNKRIIMSKIAKFIRAPRQERIAKSSLIEGVKIKDIKWLGTSKEVKLNKQDFVKRCRLLQDFLCWLHLQVVSKLVACFFHVTESTESLLFYRHELWKKLTKPFMDRYFAKYLVSGRGEKPEFSFVECDKIQGKMRLVPKAREFRVINVPFKGNKDESFAYWSYLHNEIKPVRSILLDARNKKKYSGTYCFSVGDIAKKISNYRKTIKEFHGNRPQEFYYIKFDAKSCYDSIPKDKVKQCAEHLIPQGKTFIYRQVSSGPNLKKIKSSNLLVDAHELHKLDIISNGTDKFRNKFLYDQARTVILDSEDVMKVINLQLDKTVVQIKRGCYSRTNGIFQGFPLSAVLCDIVYDELVETYMKDILEDKESLMLRVADDFMVISTNAAQIKKVLFQTQKGFGDFQVKINNEKTKLKLKPRQNAEEVIFCGLTIDSKNLNVVKTAESYGGIYFFGKSYKELYTKLVWLFKTRISNHIIQANDHSYIEVNLVNTLHILRNVMQLFAINRRKKCIEDIFHEEKFVDFCNEILNTSWKALKLADSNLEDVNHMWRDIIRQECIAVIFENLIEDKI